MTTPTIEQRVNSTIEKGIEDIWAYCRENRDSPDSERACRMIRVVLERATAEVRSLMAAERRRADDYRDKANAWKAANKTLKAELKSANKLRDDAQSLLEQIVCTEGEDAGVVLVDHESPTHIEDGVEVYDLEYFSPLGDALIELWNVLNQTEDNPQ